MRRKQKRKFKTVDWQELEHGDVIKIIGGHGPYMMIDGEKHNIGTPRGQYTVVKLVNEGIRAMQGINHYFIYMGPEIDGEVCIRAPHKFKKVLSD